MKRDTRLCISFHLAPYIELNKRAFVSADEKRLFTAIRLNADQREDLRDGELVKKQGVGLLKRRTTTTFRTVRGRWFLAKVMQ